MKMTPDALRITIELTKPFPFQDEDVERYLLEQGFDRPKDDERILVRFGKDGTQSQAFRWMRDGVNAFYEPTLGRLSVDGREVKKISESFEKLLQATTHLMEEVKDVKVRWTELLAKFRVYGEPSPLDTFRSIGHSKAEDLISENFGEKMHAFSLTLCSSDGEEPNKPLNKIENWVHLTVRPLVPNPSVYVLDFVYRKSDPIVVKKRIDTLIESFEKMLKALGVRET